MNLLIEAFEVNLKHKQYELATETLRFLPKDVADKLRQKLPKVEYSDLAGSIVDWENHADFMMSGACFLCGRAFTREESKLIGVGPVCGNWNYSFNPRDPKNKEKLEGVKRTIRQKVIEGKSKLQYKDLVHLISKMINATPIIRITETRPKAIKIDIDGKMKAWIPVRHCVYYFGAFYVRSWKAREIIGEFTRRL